MKIGSVAELAGLALLLAFSGHAAELPPVPEKPDLKRYESIPAPWHGYLLQARAAERIADPLQRCLAFPDLPGNEWPKGHAQAHCLFHHDSSRIPLAEIGKLVDQGDLDELENIMDAALARHFAEQGRSEVIHLDLNFGEGNEGENEKVAKKWLDAAPGSAYANTAYAYALLNKAWRIRGGKFASETPDEDWAGKTAVAASAIPYFEKAIKLNPKLVVAYDGLYSLGMLESRDDLKAAMLAAMQKVDPLCVEFVGHVSNSMRPRWGGSYEQMLAYSQELARHMDRRPEFATYLARPYGDRGSILLKAGQYDQATNDVLSFAVKTGSDEDSLLPASDAARRIEKDEDKAAIYLSQASRFKSLNPDAAVILAWYLVRMEPEISVRYALMALKEAPDDALAHYVAGAGYYNSRMYDAADEHYRIAIEDGEQRHASLREVADMWLSSGVSKDETVRKAGAIRAKPYINRLQSEYPDDGRGAIMAFWSDVFVNKIIREPAIRNVLKKVDRSDPWQADKAKQLDAMLVQVKSPGK